MPKPPLPTPFLSKSSLTAATLTALVVVASGLGLTPTASADARLRPQLRHELPSFGMRTSHDGYGERVVAVYPGGIAWRLGLERGDTILSFNRTPLAYRGAWWDALDRAVRRGGPVVLTVQDHRTGRIAPRYTELPVYDDPFYGGPVVPGPVTPKVRVTQFGPRVIDPCVGPLLGDGRLPGNRFPSDRRGDFRFKDRRFEDGRLEDRRFDERRSDSFRRERRLMEQRAFEQQERDRQQERRRETAKRFSLDIGRLANFRLP